MTLGEAADIRHTVAADTLETSQADNVSDRVHSTNRSSLPRNMAWTTSRGESVRIACDFQLPTEPPSPATGIEDLRGETFQMAYQSTRGRTVSRLPRRVDPLTHSSPTRESTLVELKTANIGRRSNRISTSHECSKHPSTLFDDSMLEPCPPVSNRAPLSEVLNPSDKADKNDIYRDETNSEFKQPRPTSTAQLLAAETLEQIYYHLSPSDFHSARHTCRSWFIKSIELTLLRTMCRRGGFAGSMQKELARLHTEFPPNSKSSDEWLISKRLSRECALGPHWKGNGFELPGNTNNSAFVHATTIEFTGVASQPDFSDHSGNIFTVSSCGHFLMAANGCLIYVYKLNRKGFRSFADRRSPALQPVTSIICPARVLACSMDTSSSRYAIAVLLDGRMGMVCDLTVLSNKSYTKQRTRPERRSPLLDRVTFNSSGDSDDPFVFSGIAATSHTEDALWRDADLYPFPITTSSSRNGSISRGSVLAQSQHDKTPFEQEKFESDLLYAIPMEKGPRSLYRNICSEDDPPRSVAICPQRRCVAFGCSSGIELHWVDALTGQDLNRWFPLTSPSDFLFFLPPRKDVDSPKKLRLISSAARPSDKSAILQKAFGSNTQGSSTFWQRLGWDLNSECRSSNSSSVDRSIVSQNFTNPGRRVRNNFSNHFRAIPLSDGHHVLFTDPASGCICLGSDAPIGGPTKLIRKIWFEGPPDLPPVLYAGGSDFSWGVRIVAAYGTGIEQRVWFFSVPWDIFSAGQDVSTPPMSPIKYKSTFTQDRNFEWQAWVDRKVSKLGPTINTGANSGTSQQITMWPLKISGQEICSCNDLVDLAIDSGPDMMIWTFANNGVTTAWTLDDGRSRQVKNSLVMPDGTLREKDINGDVVMLDLEAQDNTIEDLTSYDGESATRESPCSPRLRCRSFGDISDQPLSASAWVAGKGRYEFEHLAWTILECGTVNQTTHWTCAEYGKSKTDYIARLDVEIH